MPSPRYAPWSLTPAEMCEALRITAEKLWHLAEAGKIPKPMEVAAPGGQRQFVWHQRTVAQWWQIERARPLPALLRDPLPEDVPSLETRPAPPLLPALRSSLRQAVSTWGDRDGPPPPAKVPEVRPPAAPKEPLKKVRRTSAMVRAALQARFEKRVALSRAVNLHRKRERNVREAQRAEMLARLSEENPRRAEVHERMAARAVKMGALNRQRADAKRKARYEAMGIGTGEPPALLSVDEASYALGITPSQINRLGYTGRFPAPCLLVGRGKGGGSGAASRLWAAADLRSWWCENRPGEEVPRFLTG